MKDTYRKNIVSKSKAGSKVFENDQIRKKRVKTAKANKLDIVMFDNLDQKAIVIG